MHNSFSRFIKTAVSIDDTVHSGYATRPHTTICGLRSNTATKELFLRPDRTMIIICNFHAKNGTTKIHQPEIKYAQGEAIYSLVQQG